MQKIALKDYNFIELIWVYIALRAMLGVRQRRDAAASHEVADLLVTFCKEASSTRTDRTERDAFIAAHPMPQPVSSPIND